MKTLFYLFLILTLSSITSYAQTTAIPDTAFEAKLIEYGIDSDSTLNGQILNSDAVGVTSLYIQGNSFQQGNITSLQGIEAFVDLEYLNCSHHKLTSLDLSNNLILYDLNCSENNLDSIDVSMNTVLAYLNCSANNLDHLDVSSNTALLDLNCQTNNLTSLDLSTNTSLVRLNCIVNSLTELDLTSNSALVYAYCSVNLLDSLDISANTSLIELECYNNGLTSLITNNPTLETLDCQTNNLTSLDLSMDTSLVELYCSSNNLTNLDLLNNINLYYLYCNYNQLTYLGVEGLPSIAHIECYYNQLENLSLANTSTIIYIGCHDNLLKKLDLTNSTIFNLACFNNEPLLEICVSDVAAALAIPQNQWFRDASSFFTENCSYPKAVEGDLLVDANNNCIADSTEQALFTQLLMFENGIDTIYTATNDTGYYLVGLDTGTYMISVIPSDPYYTVCPSSQPLSVDTNYLVQRLDFALQEIVQCPYLKVDISAPILRRCFSNYYYVYYCNTGTVDAASAYVDVELDTTLYYNSSSIPLQSQVGNKYRFNLGAVAVGQCGYFSINIGVSCHAQLGQIHCAEAHIAPDSLCLSSLVNIQVEDTCLVDTVQFTVQNYADPFAYSLTYFILEDTTIVDTGSILLGTGQQIDILYPTGGLAHTYQLIVAPNDAHYYTVSSPVSCHPNAASYELIFNPHHHQVFIATDCQANRGSYDPNDKQAMPIGYGVEHHILPNLPLEYKVRFQNTGTDTAIFINILDTLSPNLDVGSLEMGASSHPYTWELMPANSTGEKVLRVNFDQIYLPDSNVNEAASHGFIKYKIKQQPNLPNGIRIENKAAIYFDYNVPVITNTVFHTICDNCLPTDITGVITSQEELISQTIDVQVQPNPFSTETTIEVKGEDSN